MNIKEKLCYCETVGGLTPSDLARLLQRPRATVVTWKEGRLPRKRLRMEIIERLDKLIYRIDKGSGPLVSNRLNESQRVLAIESIRDELFRIPEKDFAR